MTDEQTLRAILSDEHRLNAAFREDRALLPALMSHAPFLKALFDGKKSGRFIAFLDKLIEVDQWEVDRTFEFLNGGDDLYADAETLRRWIEDKGKCSDALMDALVENPALHYRLQMDKPRILGALLEKAAEALPSTPALAQRLKPLLMAQKFKEGSDFNIEGGLNSEFWKEVFEAGEKFRKALSQRDIKTIDRMLKRSDVTYFIDKKDGNGETALIVAAVNGYTEIAQALINKGANLDEKNNYGTTALMLAVHNGRTEIAQALINKGAKLDEKNNDGYTALIWAAWNGHTEIAQALINKGAKLDEKNDDGYTALMQAAYNGRAEIAQALINKGAKLDEKNDDGYTALLLAESYNQLDVVDIIKAARKGRGSADWQNRMNEQSSGRQPGGPD